MTDQTAGSAGAYDPLQAALVKLEEVKAEGSLPADAVVVLEEGLNSQSALRDGLGRLQTATADGYNQLDARVLALETRPQAQISAAGFDLAPLANAITRIQEARANGAIGSVVATILEDVFAALGAQQAPPPPLTEEDRAEINEAAQQGQTVEEARAEEQAAPAVDGAPAPAAEQPAEQPAEGQTTEQPTGGQ